MKHQVNEQNDLNNKKVSLRILNCKMGSPPLFLCSGKLISVKILHDVLNLGIKESKNIIDNLPQTINDICESDAIILQTELHKHGTTSEILNENPMPVSIKILDHNGFKIKTAKIIHNVLDINLRESRDIVDKIPTAIDKISIIKAKMLQERFTEYGIKSKILQ